MGHVVDIEHPDLPEKHDGGGGKAAICDQVNARSPEGQGDHDKGCAIKKNQPAMCVVSKQQRG
ncbi:hypothetical protein D3C80_2102970 [compost metagenome]